MTASRRAGTLADDRGEEVPPLLGLIDRVIGVVECVGAGRPPTLSDISRRTGLPLSTVHRLLAALVARGVIERCGRHYALGQRMRWISEQPTQPEDHQLCRVSHPHLVEHLTATGLPVALGILRDQRVRYLEALSPGAHPASGAYLAVHAPLHCTAAGKLLLAYGR
jgi:IclR family acetate operon transcriptional repressor